jgi:hypothetical protein
MKRVALMRGEMKSVRVVGVVPISTRLTNKKISVPWNVKTTFGTRRLAMNPILVNEFVGSYQPVEGMTVIGPGCDRGQDNWVQGCVDGYLYYAKVYAEPSEYGINGGRVSKLQVTKNGDVIFNFDRGPDVGNRNCSTVKKILRAFASALTSLD